MDMLSIFNVNYILYLDEGETIVKHARLTDYNEMNKSHQQNYKTQDS